MISFDEWLKNQGKPDGNFLRRETFEAGQQSQQQKIDDLNSQLLMLQKRIDDAINLMSKRTVNNCVMFSDDLIEVLKGEPK